MKNQDLYAGLIRLHILYHAAKGEVFGLGIIQELSRHKYEISPGTIYPMLHRMQLRGYLTSREHRKGRAIRRSYRATAAGRAALATRHGKFRNSSPSFLRSDVARSPVSAI
jgi:DNA-binding PadR family transcriptional regulator